MLIKYVRDKNRNLVGVVVAIGRDQIGWSKCNFKKGDRFNKDLGKQIAIARAKKYKYYDDQRYSYGGVYILYFFDEHKGAKIVKKDFLEMVRRARFYFKEESNDQIN